MDPLRLGYIAIFAGTSVTCLWSVRRAVRIADGGTRRGLVGLLLCSGVWAAASASRIALPSPALQQSAYLIGLVGGLASVGSWLYFCSAYAGYDYHKQSTVRRLAVSVFLIIISVKLTNPIHSLYFTATSETVPFPHLSIELSVLHWLVTGLAYALTAVGFYLLYELFREAQFETTSLAVLAGLTAAPVLVNVVGFAELAPNLILQFDYEPIGVALFAVGVLYVVDETFVALPRRWRSEFVNQFADPIILLTHDGYIRGFNEIAAERFPRMSDSHGNELQAVAPELAAAIETPGEVLKIHHDGSLQFYTVRQTPLSRDGERAGKVLLYNEITDIEAKRRELQRQNDQLNDFSVALNHELRNAITVIQGFIDQSAQSVTHGTQALDGNDITRATDAVARMQRVIDELSTLARYGQTPEETSECDLASTVACGFEGDEFAGIEWTVRGDATIVANHPRLETLFREAAKFARANGATTVTVDLEGETLTITDDGTPLSPAVVDDALEFGPPVPEGDAMMSLPNIRLLARVQGWTAEIDTAYTEGVRISIHGITSA